MTTTYTQKRYIKIKKATQVPQVLVDAVHAADPGADYFTGEIAVAVASITGCNSIISTVSRETADLNRTVGPDNKGAVKEYRKSLRKMLTDQKLLSNNANVKQPFLHIAIHGMTDKEDKDVVLGTRYGKSCSLEVRDWLFIAFNEALGKGHWDDCKPLIVQDKGYPGDCSIEFHRHGDKSSQYKGYGRNFHTVQVELAHWLREQHRKEVVRALSRVVHYFRADFIDD